MKEQFYPKKHKNQIGAALSKFTSVQAQVDNPIIKRIIYAPTELQSDIVLNDIVKILNNFKQGDFGEIEFFGSNLTDCPSFSIRDDRIEQYFYNSMGTGYNALFDSGLFCNITDFLIYNRNMSLKHTRFIDVGYLAKNLAISIYFLKQFLHEIYDSCKGLTFYFELENIEDSILVITAPNRAGFSGEFSTEKPQILVKLHKNVEDWEKTPVIEIVKEIMFDFLKDYQIDEFTEGLLSIFFSDFLISEEHISKITND